MKTTVMRRCVFSCASILGLLSACGDANEHGGKDESTGTLSAALTVGPTHDVSGIHFKVVAGGAACSDPAIAEKTVPLEEEGLPTGLLASGAGEGHPFADGLFVLPPGNYTVCATPVREDGTPSTECSPISGDALVVEGATTEIVLIAQCEGDSHGGLDAVVGLNDPPQIDDLVIKESKFVTECEDATITVSASDPNGDALTYDWQIVSGPAGDPGTISGSGPTVSFTAGEAGDYELKVTVTDPYGRAASLTFPIHVSPEDCGNTKTWTIDGDFEEGTPINVGHDPSDQLQLLGQAKTFNFVWIAASARGTIVKIDGATGAVLGEYKSAPDTRPKNPSRTTVDANGNVWATNRDEFEGGKGSVVHIGLFENGQCVDRNGNGTIETSTGLGDIRGWANATLVDNDGGVETAEDECIIHYTRVTGTATRHLSLDANNDVWVGGLGDADFELVDGVTGDPVPGTQFNIFCGGYGGVTDHQGVVWSARAPMLRWDPATNSGMCINLVPGAYGTALDPVTGHLWVSELGGSDSVHEIDPITNTVLNSYPQGFGAQGLTVDSSSHVWVAEIFGSRIAHFAPDPMNPSQHLLVGYVTGLQGTTGVSVGADGKIWASEIFSSPTNGAARIDPNAGPIGAGGYPVGAIDLTVGLDNGLLPPANPYNYSDFTGSTLIAPPPEGTWTVVYDAAVISEWGLITWNDEPQGSTPSDSQILVQVRSSDDLMTWSAVESVSDGADVMSPDARYLEIQVKLVRATTGETPILSDLTINSSPL